MADEDELERTIWDRVRRRGPRYEESGPSTNDALKWVPLIVVAVTAAVGYGTLTASVANIKEAQRDDRQSYRDWNVSISARVRELERGE